jgi:hypothetical protein
MTPADLIKTIHRPVVAVTVPPGSSASKEFEIRVAAAKKAEAETDLRFFATTGRAIEAERRRSAFVVIAGSSS